MLPSRNCRSRLLTSLLTLCLFTACGDDKTEADPPNVEEMGGSQTMNSGGKVSEPEPAGQPSSGGIVAAGCALDTDCAADQYCAGATADTSGTCKAGCRSNGIGCESGQVCTDDHVCVTPPCSVDAECPSETYCADDGNCVEGCRLVPGSCAGDDNDSNRACDPGTRNCVALIRCCPAGEACRDEFPSNCDDQSCSAETPCPGNQVCGETGICAEADTCTGEADCLGDRLCLEGQCKDPCTENANCSGREICEAGRCVSPPDCRVDGQCGNGQRCIDGTCVNGCGNGADCPAGFRCEENNVCVVDAECSEAGDCANGQCVEGRCVVACNDENPCPEGQRCGANNECEPDICRDDAECEGAQYCEVATGECLEPCMGNESCQNNQICNPVTTRCIDPVGCEGDLDCPRGQECSDASICVEPPECLEDIQCGDGNICEDNVCEPGCTDQDGARACGAAKVCNPGTLRCVDDACMADNQCPNDFVCTSLNVCRPGCALTNVCPGNRVCNRDTGRCPELRNSCQSLEDCDEGRICDCAARGDCDDMGGVCQTPCRNDASCQQNNPRSFCNILNGLCEVDPNACNGPNDDFRCGRGRICGENGRCVNGCRVDQDCGGGEVCLDNNQCGLQPECQNDAQCRAGFRCEAGLCTNNCGGPADCPAGFLCNDNQACELDLACADDTDCLDINDTICVDGVCSARCVDSALCPGAQVCLRATGRCIDGCANDLDCPGQICNPATAQCEDRPGCLNDNDGVCAPNEICVDQQCVSGCTVNPGLCAADQRCDEATKRCVDRLCQSANDCEAGELCTGGRCAPGCGLAGGPICRGARVCNQLTGLCAEPAQCRLVEDCDVGRVCDCLANGGDCIIGGSCIDACGPATPCQEGVCDPQGSGYCINAPGVCQNDGDCVGGNICEGGGCVESCLTRPCSGTRMCDAQTGRCPQPAQCFSDDDCDAPTKCDIGTNACVATCNGALPCANGLVCDDTLLICRGCQGVVDCPNERWTCNQDTGVCTAPAACFDNVDCPAAQVCDVVSGGCVDGCANNDECPGNQVCGAGSICQENQDGCAVAEDCVRGRVCAQGSCEEPCVGDNGCPGQQTCSQNTGLCQEAAAAACNDDVDCIGNRVCLAGTCRDRQCLTNADCAGVCVDFVCVDQPPQECLANADCGAGQECSPAGACIRTAAGCTEDVECPAGTPYCRGGECLACEIDGECGAGFACVSDRCVYLPPPNCAADNECPGSQRCEANDDGDFVCAPGPCPGNALDGQTVVARTYTGLVLCDGAIDVYRYEVAANEGVEVTVRHAPDRGDIALEIRDDEAVQGRVDGLHGTEVLSILPRAEARILDIAVSGRAGRSTSYDLSIRALAQNECGPDQYEGPLGNNTQERAFTIGLGRHDLNLCSGEHDWLRIPAASGTDLTVSFTGLNNDLSASLIGPNNMPIAGNGNANEVTTSVIGRGDYWVRMSNDGAQSVPLQIEVTSVPSANGAEQACQNALQLNPNVPLRLPEQYFVPRFNLACAPEGAGAVQEHVLTFEVLQTSEVNIELSGIVYAAVGVHSQCNVADADDPCGYLNEADGFTLNGGVLDPGTYFLVVKSIPSQRPTVQLDVLVIP